MEQQQQQQQEQQQARTVNGIYLPALCINKNDAKYLSKVQVKKAQFLFENDYFIWNEAEMYLRYHDLFSTLPNADVLYENVCKTTRNVFNLIHDVHFAGTGSNAAHLKFFEVLVSETNEIFLFSF